MENKEIPECPNSSKSQEKQNHRKKMVVTVKSAVDCARRCHQHINCNNFNFRRINMKCELVGARKTDSKQRSRIIIK
jgi:hypothetical protein